MYIVWVCIDIVGFSVLIFQCLASIIVRTFLNDRAQTLQGVRLTLHLNLSFVITQVELNLTVLFPFPNMELNRAQRLVHNDEVMAQFRSDHDNPDDVLIKRPRPKKVASIMQGHGDRIPIHMANPPG